MVNDKRMDFFLKNRFSRAQKCAVSSGKAYFFQMSVSLLPTALYFRLYIIYIQSLYVKTVDPYLKIMLCHARLCLPYDH